jgi:hypothetical protein
MNRFYVSGGRLRSTVFRNLEEWQSCDQATLIEIDPSKNSSRVCVEYISAPEACPDELPAICSSRHRSEEIGYTPAPPPKCWSTGFRISIFNTTSPCPASMTFITFVQHNEGPFW